TPRVAVTPPAGASRCSSASRTSRRRGKPPLDCRRAPREVVFFARESPQALRTDRIDGKKPLMVAISPGKRSREGKHRPYRDAGRHERGVAWKCTHQVIDKLPADLTTRTGPKQGKSSRFAPRGVARESGVGCWGLVWSAAVLCSAALLWPVFLLADPAS